MPASQKPEGAQQSTATSTSEDPNTAPKQDKSESQSTKTIRDNASIHGASPKRDEMNLGSTSSIQRTSDLHEAQAAEMTIITIPDSPNSKTTVVIESEDDHP